MNNRIKELKLKELSWKDIASIIKDEYGEEISPDACRKRYEYIKDKPEEITNEEYKTIYGDGTIEAQVIANLPREIKDNPSEVLKAIGYNPNEWELQTITISNWQQHTKEQITKDMYAVKVRLKPKTKELEPIDYLKVAREVFKDVKPMKIEASRKPKDLDPNLMIEFLSPELHLGKLAWEGDAENYDHHIAQDRFKKIIKDLVEEQRATKADTLFVTIGQDFFNSEANSMTTAGTPQNNDLRYKKMFLIGLKLWTEALLTLRKEFNKIDVQLVQGNHSSYGEFYLFVAIQSFFRDDSIINFSENLKFTSVYTWGDCAIFLNHGDVNYKRLVASIPNEFRKEWGNSIYKELHLGHLHSEFVADEAIGLITRRVGSPSAVDDWHNKQRFLGSVQKHQLFTWHKQHGLLQTTYITFNEEMKTR